MTVRAKFRVDAIERTKWGDNEVQTIKLSVVTSGSDENKTYWKYTPSGTITLGTINKAAADAFDLNKEFYVDFTPADSPTA